MADKTKKTLQQYTKAEELAWEDKRDMVRSYIEYRRLADHSQDTIPLEYEIAEYAFLVGFMAGTLHALSLMPKPAADEAS